MRAPSAARPSWGASVLEVWQALGLTGRGRGHAWSTCKSRRALVASVDSGAPEIIDLMKRFPEVSTRSQRSDDRAGGRSAPPSKAQLGALSQPGRRTTDWPAPAGHSALRLIEPVDVGRVGRRVPDPLDVDLELRQVPGRHDGKGALREAERLDDVKSCATIWSACRHSGSRARVLTPRIASVV